MHSARPFINDEMDKRKSKQVAKKLKIKVFSKDEVINKLQKLQQIPSNLLNLYRHKNNEISKNNKFKKI